MSFAVYLAGVDPRAGGETLEQALDDHIPEGRSPRGRGNPTKLLAGISLIGSIPARAGKP